MTTAQIEGAAGASLPSRPRRVALFATCFNDTMWPEAPKATVRLLERLGVQVDFPMEQTCCGQMFTNTGYANDAKGLVRGFVDTFDAFDYVVAPSGSCTGSVREQHEMIAERVGDQGLAREVDALAPRVLELSEFLVDVLGVTDVGAYFPHRVTYHPTCHSLRIAKVGDRPYKLLGAVEGIDLAPLPDAEVCCGFGGTFAMKNHETSTAMLADKVTNVMSTHAEVLCMGDYSCLMHVGGGLSRINSGVKIMHLAEILASTKDKPFVGNVSYAPTPEEAMVR